MDQQDNDAGMQQPRSHDSQRIFNIAPVITALIGLCAAIHFTRMFLFSAEIDFLTLYFGAFIPARYGNGLPVTLESFTSIATYSVLHGGFLHLLNNSIWLAAFGSPLANTIGTAKFLLFWLICTMAAASFHYVGHIGDSTPMIGASGAVSGCMGAAARFGFSMAKDEMSTRFKLSLPPLGELATNRSVVSFLALFLVSNIMIGAGQFDGAAASIAWQAHIGGMVAGFLLIPFFVKPLISRHKT